MRPSDPMRRFRTPLAALPLAPLCLLWVVSCGGDDAPRQRALLRDFALLEPGAACSDPATPEAPPGLGPRGARDETVSAPANEPRPVARGHSQREALLTCDGVSLAAGFELAEPGRDGEPWVLDLSLALAQSGDEPAGATSTAVLELRRDGEATVLLEERVEPGGWTEHRVELPAAAGFFRSEDGAELVLRSRGGPAVAWAGLHAGAPPEDGGDAGAGTDGPTSLILVSLDTVRADNLSLYGYERPTSPRLDRLGEESLVFTRALSASSWTLPSTATLLTGLLPAQHGAVHWTKQLPGEVVTVAERLRQAGYRTAALTDGGFAGYPWGFAQGFDRYDVTPGVSWATEQKDVARTFRDAADWVRTNRHRPFFLFLHTYEAHQPYLAREGFADPFLPPGERGDETLSMVSNPNENDLSEAELHRMVALYDGEIARADHYLGGFLDALEEAGLAGDVAIVVTSDHGEEFLEHGDLEHAFGKVFDANVRVPLVVRAPGVETAPRRVHAPVSGIDVAPTLLALAGLPHDDLPGRSLLDVARDAGPGESAESAERSTRPALVHGIPSFPRLTAERFRIDGAGSTAILERVRAREVPRLLRYRVGRGTVEPWAEGSGGGTPVPRLAALLAWSRAPLRDRATGGLFARLPDDARSLAVPAGSRVVPRAVWNGTSWHPWTITSQGPGGRRRPEDRTLTPGGPAIELPGDGPRYLVFDLAPEGERSERARAGEPWGLTITRAEAAEPEPYRLSAGRRPPWDPFADPLPEPGVVLPTASRLSAEAGELDEETERELKALGYL